jgi:ADP-ribosylglycohydrolase
MIDRYRGCLLGLAVGDALGTTLEFQRRGDFDPLTDMVGGGPFALEPGQWTDDTSMALCLAESLIECRRFDPVDQLRRYCRWRRDGHLSSTGECFDIGNTVAGALDRFETTGEPFCGSTDEYTAGNGSLMRLAPVPMAFAADAREAVSRSGDSSRTTHSARECIDACRYMGALIVGALRGASKHELLSDHYAPTPDLWADEPLAQKIDNIAGGSFKHKSRSAIETTGYVVHNLEAALWAFWHADSFREGALLAVNLAGDADTTGAIYGQLAGGHYGMGGIPESWLDRLACRHLIQTYSENLHKLALSPQSGGE